MPGFTWSDEAVEAFMHAAVLPPKGKFNTPRLNVPKGMSAAMVVDGPRAFVGQMEVFLGQVAKMLDERGETYTTSAHPNEALTGGELLQYLFSEPVPEEPTDVPG